jgi:HSP20 family protein
MLPRNATVRDFDRLRTRVFDSATRGAGCRLDAYRVGDTSHTDIDLPGVDPAGIEVSTDHHVLTIRAERKPGHDEGLRLVAADGRPTPCVRQVVLADSLDTDRLDARYDKGVVTLSIPIVESAQPHQVEIELPDAA